MTLYRGAEVARVRDIEHQVTVLPGTEIYERARIWLHLDDGVTSEIVAEPLTTRAWAARWWLQPGIRRRPRIRRPPR